MAASDLEINDCTVSAGEQCGGAGPAAAQAAQYGRAAGAGSWAAAGFTATVLASAFLLFQVQPLISKAILPWFGGCPAVWTTCMLFFQVLLFGGYAFAHLVEQRIAPRWQTIVHLALVVAALALLPILPAVGWKPAGGASPTWRILGLLAATVGLPYFVLSATSPLVQVWFHRRYPERSCYRLYAVSNFGSLAALLSYPLVFEPALGLDKQSWLWSGGFAVYAVFCGLGALVMWRTGRRSASPESCPGAAPAGAEENPVPSLWQRALWLLLPACASLMLLATTNHVCQDVAVVPLLWIVPLALYLVSFIVCFDRPHWYCRSIWSMVALAFIVSITGLIALHNQGIHWQTCLPEMLVCFAALLAVCMVCHGELVRLRPHPRRLTEFYLIVAAGGALGGALVSLVAPLVFRTYVEWPIGLLLCYGVAAVALLRPKTLGRARLPRLVAGIAATVGLVCVAWCHYHPVRPLAQWRNFYGAVAVYESFPHDPARHQISLVHAGTTHGQQFRDAKRRLLATTYYAPPSGVGQAMRYAQRRPKLRVGVVGLGAGTLAAYARPGDHYVFYEINPEIWRVADATAWRQAHPDARPDATTYFTYLQDARERAAAVDVVLGDARLSLEEELSRAGSRQFDILVLDAFSGDSVPVHLLTREAFALYRRHLAPGGLLAVHITNNYLSLAPVVRAAAADCRLAATRVYWTGDADNVVYHSDWMLLGDDPQLSRAIPAAPPADADDDFRVRLWTDRYSNLLGILKM